MDFVVILLVLVVIGAVAAGVYLYQRKQRSDQLREQFGPEYERTVSGAGKKDAERDLRQRVDRMEKVELRDLSSEESREFSARWKAVQADFVDRPETAIGEADALVQEVMGARGYPTSGFEQRTSDLSVQHAAVIDHYREAHEISESHRQSPRSTEDLRQAMIHYRAIFSDLLMAEPSHS